MTADGPKHVFDLAAVTKRYEPDRSPANKDLTFAIAQGEIFGILGDNGAGKTTLVRQMVGLVAPTSGDLRFLGVPVAEAERLLTTHVGYMPQSAFALNNLTVREAIFFTARLRGCSRREARAEASRLLSMWGLEALTDRVAKQLSGGQRRLLQLAVTFAADPPVVILDEPTNDLDPVNRKRLWQLLTTVNDGGKTIIFVTHDAVEAEKVIHRVAIMRDGRIVALGRPAELKQEIDNKFRLELTGNSASLGTLPVTARWTEPDPGRWVAVFDKEDICAIMASIDVHQFEDIRLGSATLEDLYLHYAQQS